MSVTETLRQIKDVTITLDDTAEPLRLSATTDLDGDPRIVLWGQPGRDVLLSLPEARRVARKLVAFADLIEIVLNENNGSETSEA